uniref:Plac8 onzin related protein 2 n=1 Tax=Neogobius melanostomus TaxID=47308 RepID=A0A8C6TS28_9GOBI
PDHPFILPAHKPSSLPGFQLRGWGLVQSGPCCFAFWCSPCFSCITAKKYGECLCLPLLDGFGLIPPISMSMRVSMRQRYGIRGNMCRDCVYSFFCVSCSWCQMSREMKRRQIPIVLVNARYQ